MNDEKKCILNIIKVKGECNNTLLCRTCPMMDECINYCITFGVLSASPYIFKHACSIALKYSITHEDIFQELL